MPSYVVVYKVDHTAKVVQALRVWYTVQDQQHNGFGQYSPDRLYPAWGT